MKTETKVLAALTRPCTLAEVAARTGVKPHEALTVLSNLLAEKRVKRGNTYPCLFWLAS